MSTSSKSNLAPMMKFSEGSAVPAGAAGPVLSASRRGSVAASGSNVYKYLEDKLLWVFMIVAIIVLIVLFLLSREGMKRYKTKGKDCKGKSWYESLHMYRWGKSTAVWAVVLVVGVLLFAWAAYVAYVGSNDQNTKNMIITLLGLVMIGLIALFAVFFSKVKCAKDSTSTFSTSLWLAILVGVLTLGFLYSVWGNMWARLALIPFMVYIIMMIILLADLAKYYKRDCEKVHSQPYESDCEEDLSKPYPKESDSEDEKECKKEKDCKKARRDSH